MKKSLKLFALGVLAVFAFSTTACTKCQTCKHIASDGTVLWTWESCGDKNTATTQKDDCNTTADSVPGSECNCTINFTF
ncbi:hypothetical protein JYT14_00795 [Flavobacteriales bacterium AH-315-E23]|nr:hypothetical protein [Flavobacteriales bacterium AH-315-E23]